MEAINMDFKGKIAFALQNEISSRGFADTPFLQSLGIKKEVCNHILKGKTDKLMSDADWLRLGRKLKVNEHARQWNTARTDVYINIEQDILFCKAHAKAKIYVDECGIGKSFTAKCLAATLNNCFYVDASQGRTILLFTKLLADAIGLQSTGKYSDIKEDIKMYLKMIDSPIVIIDEAGDLGQVALQEIKEFWNATEGYCGWYLMGAEGLKSTINKGIKHKKPGFKEIFSRFSDRYTTTVPLGKEDKLIFYKKLVTDVLTVNMTDKSNLKEIVTRCLVTDQYGNISGLRRAESLLILHSNC